MHHSIKKILLIIFATILSELLIGCTSQPIAIIPTLDQSQIVAEVVNTINAQNTMVATLQPTKTNLPTPSQTFVLSTPTLVPEKETPTFTMEDPTSTPTQESFYSASLQYVVSYPENKREYVGNESFNIAIGYLNSGTITWEAGSTVKLVSYIGEPTVQLEATIDRVVRPGEKIEFNFWAFGSEWYQDHTFIFQLYTAQGLAIPGGYATFTYTSV